MDLNISSTFVHSRSRETESVCAESHHNKSGDSQYVFQCRREGADIGYVVGCVGASLPPKTKTQPRASRTVFSIMLLKVVP